MLGSRWKEKGTQKGKQTWRKKIEEKKGRKTMAVTMFPGPKSREICKHSSLELICSSTLDGTIIWSLGKRNICQFNKELGILPPKLLPVTSAFGCSHPGKILKEAGALHGCKKIGWSCHTPPYCLGNYIQGFLCPSITHALIFLTADTTTDLFKDSFQWCASNTHFSKKKGGKG